MTEAFHVGKLTLILKDYHSRPINSSFSRPVLMIIVQAVLYNAFFVAQ